MELENQAVKQTYIKLLTDILYKKSKTLENLLELTKQQEIVIVTDDLDENEFLKIVNLKEEQINHLTTLDDGFEQLYQSVRDELAGNSDKYSSDIAVLKELITVVTNRSIEIQALEKRNKIKIENYFSNKRKEIRNSRVSNQTVTNYYKTMTNQQENSSFFYDKKK